MGKVSLVTDSHSNSRSESTVDVSQVAHSLSGVGSWNYNLLTEDLQLSSKLLEILAISPENQFLKIDEMKDFFIRHEASIWVTTLNEVLTVGEELAVKFHVTCEGKVRWLQARFRAFKNSANQVIAVAGSLQDVTEFWDIHQKLADTQILLNTILDHMPGPVYSKAVDGRYLYVNKEYLKNVSMKVSNPIGKTDFDIYDKSIAHKLRVNDNEVIQKQSKVESLEHVPHPDGTVHSYRSYKFPTFDQYNSISTVTGISFDVTEEIRIKKELELERSRLIQASKMTALGEMAGGISHEINNPLAIIKGYTLRLKSIFYERIDEEARKVTQLTEDILRAVERTGAIISGFKNFARDASNDKFKRVDVNDVIDETLALCRNKFLEFQVNIELQLQPGLFVECHEVQLSQVLLNLMGNALDATLEKGDFLKGDERKVIVKTLMKKMSNGPFVTIQVHDFGVGFAKEAMPRTFEPFFTTKTSGKGTGLGLSISKSLVEKHGGTLSVDSLKNPTIVELRMPQYKEKRF